MAFEKAVQKYKNIYKQQKTYLFFYFLNISNLIKKHL